MAEHQAFGPRLRTLRERAALTQTQLAEKAGMHRQGIVKLERGEREPAWSTLLSLAAALGVKLQDFVDVEPTGPESRPRGRPHKATEERIQAVEQQADPPSPARKLGKAKAVVQTPSLPLAHGQGEPSGEKPARKPRGKKS